MDLKKEKSVNRYLDLCRSQKKLDEEIAELAQELEDKTTQAMELNELKGRVMTTWASFLHDHLCPQCICYGKRMLSMKCEFAYAKKAFEDNPATEPGSAYALWLQKARDVLNYIEDIEDTSTAKLAGIVGIIGFDR